MPGNFNEYSRPEAMINWLNCIEYDEKASSITDDIINKLPLQITKDFEKFITEENNRLLDVPIISYKSPFTKKVNNLYLTLFDDSPISFIKLIFETDLLDLYETEYFLIKDHNFSQHLFDTKSPAEIYAYISIIEKYKVKEESSANVSVGELYTGDSIDNIE
jgi:hypothetical protein